MVWIKQKDDGWPRWVCSCCGTLLIRAVDKEPLPSRCDACGEFATDAVDNPPVSASAEPVPFTQGGHAADAAIAHASTERQITVKDRTELTKFILDTQARLADAIEYGRECKKRAMWIIKEATAERIVVQCSHCREYLAIKDFLGAPVDLPNCPHCFRAMGGAVDGEESAGADAAERP